MTNPITAIVDETGMFATPVNNTFDKIGKYPPLDSDNELWKSFNDANPQRPLTIPQTPLSTIEVVEVWQYDLDGVWMTARGENKSRYGSFKEWAASIPEFDTRIAFEPLHKIAKPPLTEEYSQNRVEVASVKINAIQQASNDIHNACLDEAVMVLDKRINFLQREKNLCYRDLIKELNSMAETINTLRK